MKTAIQANNAIASALSKNVCTVTVLLVDDQVIIAEAVRRILTIEEDITFSYCSVPAQAIQKATDIKPTVILLDFMMPDIDGLLLLRFFRANPATRDIPIIMLSIKEEPKVKAEAFALGANDYLVKLPDKIELVARVRYHSKAYINLLERNAAESRLEEQTKELSLALKNLQQTQAQLIQTEKMSSLGQLVAGVAHEINNPVNFIYGNLTYASEYSQKLVNLIKLYESRLSNPDSEIKSLIEEIDLEYLIEDLPNLLSSMKIGAERIREIVLTLRNFSRHDEAKMKRVNIHQGIDSSLLILQHRLKGTYQHPTIQLSKEYSDLPTVECYAGELNQVFLNIISNAIDALKEPIFDTPDSCQLPKITITTKLINSNRVGISIKDNGLGMTPEVKTRVFDPFFTTKPVGKGTGLGLSISYQIVVEKHQGVLRCISEPGQGTEFQIEIPC